MIFCLNKLKVNSQSESGMKKFKIWSRESCDGKLVLLELKCHHSDEEEENDPRNSGDEAHVHILFHHAPAAR